jgi:hypothetical protein
MEHAHGGTLFRCIFADVTADTFHRRNERSTEGDTPGTSTSKSTPPPMSTPRPAPAGRRRIGR